MSVNEYEDEYERAHSQLTHLTHVLFMYILMPHKNGVGTLWPNLNRLRRLVPCGKGDFPFTVKPGTLQISNSSSYHPFRKTRWPQLSGFLAKI